MRISRFHEDEWGQWELLPIENLGFIQKELQEIHQVSEGDLRVRETPYTSWSDKKIPVNEISCLIPFKEYDQVFTGYGSGEWSDECPNLKAYGPEHSSLTVCIQHYEQWVTDLFLVYPFVELQQEAHFLLDFFEKLHSHTPSVYVDWQSGEIIPLSEQEKLRTYFAL